MTLTRSQGGTGTDTRDSKGHRSSPFRVKIPRPHRTSPPTWQELAAVGAFRPGFPTRAQAAGSSGSGVVDVGLSGRSAFRHSPASGFVSFGTTSAPSAQNHHSLASSAPMAQPGSQRDLHQLRPRRGRQRNEPLATTSEQRSLTLGDRSAHGRSAMLAAPGGFSASPSPLNPEDPTVFDSATRLGGGAIEAAIAARDSSLLGGGPNRRLTGSRKSSRRSRSNLELPSTDDPYEVSLARKVPSESRIISPTASGVKAAAQVAREKTPANNRPAPAPAPLPALALAPATTRTPASKRSRAPDARPDHHPPPAQRRNQAQALTPASVQPSAQRRASTSLAAASQSTIPSIKYANSPQPKESLLAELDLWQERLRIARLRLAFKYPGMTELELFDQDKGSLRMRTDPELRRLQALFAQARPEVDYLMLEKKRLGYNRDQ